MEANPYQAPSRPAEPTGELTRRSDYRRAARVLLVLSLVLLVVTGLSMPRLPLIGAGSTAGQQDMLFQVRTAIAGVSGVASVVCFVVAVGLSAVALFRTRRRLPKR